LPCGYPFALVECLRLHSKVGDDPGLAASSDDAENVAFLHDDQVFTVDLDLGARPLAEQDLVAGLDVQRRDLALVRASAGADRNHFAFLRLFLCGVGNDDPARTLLLGLDTADEDTIVKRPETHSLEPLLLSWLNVALALSP